MCFFNFHAIILIVVAGVDYLMVKALWYIIPMTLMVDTITLACGRKPSLTEKVSKLDKTRKIDL